MLTSFHSNLISSVEKFSKLCMHVRQKGIQLIFLTGDTPWKETFIKECLEHTALHCINLGMELSKCLHEKPLSELGMETEDFMRSLFPRQDVFLYNIEILFDVGMELDPVKTLKNAARTRLIVAVWPGKIDEESLKLIFAPGDLQEREFLLDSEIGLLDESGFTLPEIIE